ncbi:hypothetical protein BGZ63DRAFT_377904 [Mariannaea sp. PMI_226]|nr:hypothetical protein BGZ63DRAFT_377904 [Mariannaea sp. PMI_226]
MLAPPPSTFCQSASLITSVFFHPVCFHFVAFDTLFSTMCTLWRIRYSCHRIDHEDFRVTCERGLDCPVRKGVERAPMAGYVETCMDGNHIATDSNLSTLRSRVSPT